MQRQWGPLYPVRPGVCPRRWKRGGTATAPGGTAAAQYRKR